MVFDADGLRYDNPSLTVKHFRDPLLNDGNIQLAPTIGVRAFPSQRHVAEPGASKEFNSTRTATNLLILAPKQGASPEPERCTDVEGPRLTSRLMPSSTRRSCPWKGVPSVVL